MTGAAYLTRALTNSTSVDELLRLAAGHEPLNSIQLCALLESAKRLASGRRGPPQSAVGRRPQSGNGVGSGSGTTGAMPPGQGLPWTQAAALAALVGRHSEVVADADPPEMTRTLWAAALLRLPLPREALEPSLEAFWLWDPADQQANSGSGNGSSSSNRGPPAPQTRGSHIHAPERRAVGTPPQRDNSSAGASSSSSSSVGMGLTEACLMMSAVAVLAPDYLRSQAGGFLEVRLLGWGGGRGTATAVACRGGGAGEAATVPKGSRLLA